MKDWFVKGGGSGKGCIQRLAVTTLPSADEPDLRAAGSARRLSGGSFELGMSKSGDDCAEDEGRYHNWNGALAVKDGACLADKFENGRETEGCFLLGFISWRQAIELDEERRETGVTRPTWVSHHCNVREKPWADVGALASLAWKKGRRPWAKRVAPRVARPGSRG
ncbi:hypothetical protein N9L68_05755 [bacterium]|nr:hypothetical protein [bacterium]